MYWLLYEIKEIPDLSLTKYQSLAEEGVEGVLERTEAFLRQWQKISVQCDVNLSLYIVYKPNKLQGEKLELYLGLSYRNEEIRGILCALMNSCALKDFFNLQLVKDYENGIFMKSYRYKFTLQKCERKRICEESDSQEEISLFHVETWKGNKKSRLYDLLKTMQSMNEEVVYSVILRGADSYEKVYQSLEKPISFLRNRTINRSIHEVKLSKPEFGRMNVRDIVAEETLKIYEDFLKNVSNTPCYYGNISILSDNDVVANILLNTVCGEAIEEGDWHIYKGKEECYFCTGELEKVATIMPETLTYWPTYFSLEEIAPFFRFPVLYEGEHIEIRKETEPKGHSGEILIGNDLQGSKVYISMELLKKHAFVCGVPGAGKTNTMLHLCYSLWKECKIPFLVLEPAKKEYRALAQTDIEELLVFSPSSGSKFPLAINPFEFARGLSLAEHIQNLMEVFEGAFPLTPPLPALLDRAIEGIYVMYGWDTDDVNDGSKEYPTLRELYERLEYELEQTDYDGEVRGNMKSALEMRIGSLLRRDLGNVFDVKISTLSPENLMKYPIVIEMESLGTGPSNFMTLMLCTLIREVLRANPYKEPKKTVRHMIFIEEAHNLIASETNDAVGEDANPKVAATNYIVKMLAEVRALREGIVIADQLPTAMAPEVLKNTGLKIVHRLISTDDRGIVGSTMSANNLQMEELATYMPGNALITYEGLQRPFRMQIISFALKETPTTEQLYELMYNRELQRSLSQYTISIRLEKMKEKWKKEWDVTMVVYQQLLADCDRIPMLKNVEVMEEAVSAVVKDQIGLEKCLDVLHTIIKKYEYTLELAMEENEHDVAFGTNMKHGVDSIIWNTKQKIKRIRL